MFGSRRVLSRIAPVVERACRLLSAPEPGVLPEDVLVYEGRMYLQPADDYGEGNVMLVGEGNLVDYLYRHMDVPTEDRTRVQVNLYGRITVEALPDPDRSWWP